LQSAIDANNKETTETEGFQDDEKKEVMIHVISLQAKVNVQTSSIENLEFDIMEPRKKLLECEEELEAAKMSF